MMSAHAREAAPPEQPPQDGLGASPVFAALHRLAAKHGVTELTEEFALVERLAREDLAAVARDLEAMPPGDRGPVRASALGLLGLGGKRLRPLCVALTARLGKGFGPQAQLLAVAAELGHSATLLHDDVVDVGDTRRGQPTARTIYGNAASIFAGDWLLVEALRRVQTAGVPGQMESLLSTIEEMIGAESLQCEQRGRLDAGREVHFRVARGKTASLFRWACQAGAHAGGVVPLMARRLGDYGESLGVAFQLMDDVLDLAGESASTGKDLLADLREGKPTYPLVVAMERDASLHRKVLAFVQGEASAPAAEVVSAIARTGALEETRRAAEEALEQALAALEPLPESPIRSGLMAMAVAVVRRDH